MRHVVVEAFIARPAAFVTPRGRAVPRAVTVSFSNQHNTRVVDAPDAGSVRRAIGSMIGNAQAEGLATPAASFSAAFTPARYQEHATLGRIGPDNPPRYVSRIGSGRRMVFAMSAKSEASEIRRTLDASWRGVGASAGASLSAKQRAIHAESHIRITQGGGDQGNASSRT